MEIVGTTAGTRAHRCSSVPHAGKSSDRSVLSFERVLLLQEMKHFQELQHQIDQLEQRWHKRDQLTKDYSVSRLKEHDVESNNDITKLRAIIKQKNREIERFHLELDSMLQLLKTLKFQQLLQHR